jgi:hypothetical protein
MSESTSISRRTAQVPIFQGADVAVIEEAQVEYNRAESLRRLAESQQSGTRRMSEPAATQELTDAALAAAKVYDAAVADALPRAVMATVTALGRRSWRNLLAEHPPRDDNQGDDALGFNESTFLDAVLEFWDGETGERSVTVPQFDSRNALVEWLDNLSDGVFTELGYAAVRVNQGGSPDPKASLGSQAAQMYRATSRSPDSTE